MRRMLLCEISPLIILIVEPGPNRAVGAATVSLRLLMLIVKFDEIQTSS